MKKGKAKIWFIILLLFIVIVSGIFVYYKFIKDDNSTAVNQNTVVTPPKVEPKKLQIYKGTDRPIAVMIDNEKPAWPHSGLQDAYMIYEAIIEGGESRLMALFKNQTTAKIGPIRSARHYFAQYALENNAIFAHFGWSPKAEKVIKNNDINNINGLYDEYYWRIGYGYHNAFSSIENINKFATQKEYLKVASAEPKYKYDAEEVDLKDGKEITGLYMKYSNLHNVSYKYDEENKVFYRSMRETPHKDRETKKQYFAKNIVILYMKNYNLTDAENKGRQELNNVGTGTGYYITNGKYVDITWKKDSVSTRTLWLDENGKEIVLNDGNTFVQIVPIGNKVKFDIKAVEEPSVTVD